MTPRARRRPRALARLLGFLTVALLAAVPARAAFHFARIVEVFPGSAADPSADYIVIQAYSDFQNLFANAQVTVFAADGTPLPDFALFAADLPSSSTNQRTILVATTAAQAEFGVAPDQLAGGSLPPSGLVCFRKGLTVVDCVSYGSYTGNTGVGGSAAGPPAPAPPAGSALHRDLQGDGLLQATDDTNSSAADFFAAGPLPENFAGQTPPDLTVDVAGADIVLSWTSTAPAYSVHKLDDASLVRTSAPLTTLAVTSVVDPLPDQFPGVTFYIIKPAAP